jgi:hypothetical protein
MPNRLDRTSRQSHLRDASPARRSPHRDGHQDGHGSHHLDRQDERQERHRDQRVAEPEGRPDKRENSTVTTCSVSQFAASI